MKSIDMDALRALADMPTAEMEQKLADLLHRSGNDALRSKLNADSINRLKQQLSSLSQSQLDSLLSGMQSQDNPTLQKLRNLLNK